MLRHSPLSAPPWTEIKKGPLADIDRSILTDLFTNAMDFVFADGEEIVTAGQAMRGIFILVEGGLEFPSLPDDHEILFPNEAQGSPGAILGMADLTEGCVWPSDVVAIGTSRLIYIELQMLRRVLSKHPTAFEQLPAFTLVAHQQAQVDTALLSGSGFKILSQDARQQLSCLASLRFYPAGSHVIEKGKPADFVLIVVYGLLRASIQQENAKPILLNNIVRGQSVGEIGLILEQPRSADVFAARDTLTIILKRSAWEYLVKRDPIGLLKASTQMVHDHLRADKSKRKEYWANTFTIIPLSPKVDVHWISDTFAKALQSYGKVRHVSSQDASHLSSEDDHNQLMGIFDEGVDFVVYQADPEITPWTKRCLREADHIFFINEAGEIINQHIFENIEAITQGTPLIEHSYILLYPDEHSVQAPPANIKDPLRDIKRYNIRKGSDSDVHRLTRFVNGRAIGLVLGGGGARGFAHLGVLRALHNANIPIDAIGGNSMGALIGAQYAMEKDLGDILVDTMAFAQAGERPTLPFVSLIGGHKMRNGMKHLFGDVLIEDLRKYFFTVSCNLSQACVTRLADGPLWQAVLASNSPAGIAPPTLIDGNLLVDGAILNNLPIDIMRDILKPGRVIGIDVNMREDILVDKSLQQLSPWQVFLQRINLRKGQRLPGIVDILQRAGTIGGMAHRVQSIPMADHVFQPDVSNFSLVSYGQARAIEESGYRYASENMETLIGKLGSL